MRAVVGKQEVFLEISQTLPHIHLPIGQHENEASLLAMVDSGAGLNLGRLQYHRSIYEQQPDLVEQFMYFARSMQEFGWAMWEKVMDQKYLLAGKPVNVWFGLSNTVTTNTIWRPDRRV